MALKGRKQTEEHKRKRSIALMGKKLSPEHIQKIKGTWFQKGEKNAFEGRKHTKESKEKMRLAHIGEKSSRWIKDRSLMIYPDEWTDDLKESIRKRDNYICQECGYTKEELGHTLHIHHIDYNKDNLNPENLISLCRCCHGKTNKDRSYWIDYFNQSKGR